MLDAIQDQNGEKSSLKYRSGPCLCRRQHGAREDAAEEARASGPGALPQAESSRRQRRRRARETALRSRCSSEDRSRGHAQRAARRAEPAQRGTQVRSRCWRLWNAAAGCERDSERVQRIMNPHGAARETPAPGRRRRTGVSRPSLPRQTHPPGAQRDCSAELLSLLWLLKSAAD
jgi:hypothetical protein